MPLSHAHKANAGAAYLEEIKRRISIRTASKNEADAAAKVAKERATAAEATLLEEVAARWGKRLRLPGVVRAIRGNEYTSQSGHVPGAWLHFEGAAVFMPDALDAQLAKKTKEQSAAEKLKGDLCTELEFLHRQLSPASVAAFQAHASRMIAKTTDATIGKEAVALVDDFLAGRRTYACKVA